MHRWKFKMHDALVQLRNMLMMLDDKGIDLFNAKIAPLPLKVAVLLGDKARARIRYGNVR
jgi:hypothetical protein